MHLNSQVKFKLLSDFKTPTIMAAKNSYFE